MIDMYIKFRQAKQAPHICVSSRFWYIYILYNYIDVYLEKMCSPLPHMWGHKVLAKFWC